MFDLYYSLGICILFTKSFVWNHQQNRIFRETRYYLLIKNHERNFFGTVTSIFSKKYPIQIYQTATFIQTFIFSNWLQEINCSENDGWNISEIKITVPKIDGIIYFTSRKSDIISLKPTSSPDLKSFHQGKKIEFPPTQYRFTTLTTNVYILSICSQFSIKSIPKVTPYITHYTRRRRILKNVFPPFIFHFIKCLTINLTSNKFRQKM